MGKKIVTFILLLISGVTFAQTSQPEKKPAFDSVLAKKLGADDYGMKFYVMAFLKEGKNRSLDSTESANLQIAHLKNIMRLADEGKLIVAGPFLDNESVRGIFIFNVSTIEEARQLTATDPAIKAGVLEMELRPWYGSASLIETARLHKSIEKKSIVD
ncbi:MAG: YciI family protein [Ginsengibacter sp.]